MLSESRQDILNSQSSLLRTLETKTTPLLRPVLQVSNGVSLLYIAPDERNYIFLISPQKYVVGSH